MTRLAAAAAALVLLPACATVPMRAGADFEPGYDFTRYTSYVWDEPDERPIGDPRLENNPFFVHRLHSAIHWELATRGIEYRGHGPALAVHHHVVVRDHVEVYSAEPGTGYWSEYGDNTEVIQYQEGTFLVDIADSHTGEIVWRGWAQLDLGSALDDPMEMRDQIDTAIGKMFEGFPIPYGGRESEPTQPVERYEGR
jgi:hypothetical protein